ncbi:nucleotide-binding alpha-beta plait domain-containing protein [Tanacetum coccineum]
MSTNKGADERTEVRRRGSHNKSWNADFARKTEDNSYTFFFTRFPDSWDEKALWDLFRMYSYVLDVYLAARRTKMGTRFGFARFFNVNDIASLEKKLKGITIGGVKIVINIAKYDKQGKKVSLNEKKSTQSNNAQQ